MVVLAKAAVGGQAAFFHYLFRLVREEFIHSDCQVRALVIDPLDALVREADANHSLVGHHYHSHDSHAQLLSRFESLVNGRIVSQIFIVVDLQAVNVEVVEKSPAANLLLALVI